jgi:hypothetical protein
MEYDELNNIYNNLENKGFLDVSNHKDIDNNDKIMNDFDKCDEIQKD